MELSAIELYYMFVLNKLNIVGGTGCILILVSIPILSFVGYLITYLSPEAETVKIKTYRKVERILKYMVVVLIICALIYVFSLTKAEYFLLKSHSQEEAQCVYERSIDLKDGRQ